VENKKRNHLTTILCAIYLLLLAGVVLFKLPFYSPSLDGVRVLNLIPLQGSFDENGALGLSEIVSNVLLFIPSGVYVCLLKNEWSFTRKILPVIGLTVAFEVAQFIFAIGRSDSTDILGNTLGGVIGIGIYALSSRIFGNRTAKVVNMLALVLTVCVVARFAYLFYLSHFVMSQLSP
jgi:glycopeptide antibiotics resistance protein